MNNRPLHHWRLPIQINSLIAVFSTFSKSALMLVLAEGLSQLKWAHFERRYERLSHLQVFDDASRGPWGAFVFLLRMRKGFSMLAAVGALLTILGLAIEPFTQQVIDFPLLRTTFANESASTLGAVSFNTSNSNGPRSALMQELLNHLSNGSRGLDPNIKCSTGDCTVPSHWSLGIENSCSDEDILDDTYMHCSYQGLNTSGGATDWEYVEYKSLQEYKDDSSRNQKLRLQGAFCTNVFSEQPPGIEWRFNREARHHRKFWIEDPARQNGWYLDWPKTRPPWGFSDSPTNRSGDNITYWWAKLDHDKKQANFIAIMGLIEQSKPTSETLNRTELNSWQGVKMSKRQCDLRWVGLYTHETTINQGQIHKSTQSMPLNCTAFSRGDIGSGRECRLKQTLQNNTTPNPVFWVVERDLVLTLREVGNDAFRMPFVKDALSNFSVSDVANMMTSVLNIFIRSSQNINGTTVVGTTYGMETHIHVRWIWVILPMIVVVASVVFLILIIADASNGEQLFKSSALSGHLNNLADHPIGGDFNMRKPDLETYSQLFRKAQNIQVMLERNANGNMAFRRRE
ncbi:hypothetical protein GQ44DRAFT_663053, partial [Phaeosphaeriaceae sp. PMI808]